ncbi:hypothetical protein B0H10DRAFT_1942047 [Mycena sp. CBHHK59/15]|nr:hypothetical protein B0H10DRAFT_1942047 [Mycena sp. CBHHK59/15]
MCEYDLQVNGEFEKGFTSPLSEKHKFLRRVERDVDKGKVLQLGQNPKAKDAAAVRGNVGARNKRARRVGRRRSGLVMRERDVEDSNLGALFLLAQQQQEGRILSSWGVVVKKFTGASIIGRFDQDLDGRRIFVWGMDLKGRSRRAEGCF